ncbi:hypothetical protein D3C76_780010 [compost metagenome]
MIGVNEFNNNVNPSSPTPAYKAEKKAFLVFTFKIFAITKIIIGTNIGAPNVSKICFSV